MATLYDSNKPSLIVVYLPYNNKIRVILNGRVLKIYKCSKKDHSKTLKKVLLEYNIKPETHAYYLALRGYENKDKNDSKSFDTILLEHQERLKKNKD